MTKEELTSLAAHTSRNVIKMNRETIDTEVQQIIDSLDTSSKTYETTLQMKLLSFCLNFIPELSAVVTVNLLVDLGVISTEDE